MAWLVTQTERVYLRALETNQLSAAIGSLNLLHKITIEAGEKRKDPAASERDVKYLLDKAIASIGKEHEEGQFSVISTPGGAKDQTTLKWEYSEEKNTRYYGQADHIWTTFFDEDKWQWTKPEENIDAKADYDPY